MSLESMAVRAILVLIMMASAIARADDADATCPPPPTSHFTIAFTGGALVPRGAMQESANPGLDVGSRIGWTARNNFGFVMNLEYAPLRRDPDPTLGAVADQQVDSNLFVGTLAPRFTIGRSTVRIWFAAGGGVVVEHRSTEILTMTTDTIRTETDTEGAFSGSSGLELHFFANGGLQFSGGYTRSITSDTKQVYDFFSLDAGLVFVI
jgi:hypothetical protein